METSKSRVVPNIIKAINNDTVHKICSGQVVLSLAVAVKELVENSLDAGATNIEIRLKNYGIDSIEVSDNGFGVTEENFGALSLKYHTSKLNDYSELLGVSSFGFRGEALSSLCALANLTITTRHKSSGHATKIEYDLKGSIIKKTPCSRQIGTTVALTNLFHSLPVRQKELHKNAKREFNKMTQLLYAYCLISLGVKITCSNQISSNSKSLVVATHGSTCYKDNISCVFGIKQLQSILEMKPELVSNIKENILKGLSEDVENTQESIDIPDVEIDLSEDSNDEPKTETVPKSQGHRNVQPPVHFTGYISSCAHGSGRSSTDRQFFYVNSRPCEPTKVIKLINEIYRQYNPNQYPFVFLNVNIERTCVDVNVTPDKRKIFLTKEKLILDSLKSSLIKLFESIPRTMKIETPSSSQCVTDDSVKPELSQPRIFNAFMQKFSKIKSESNSEEDINDHQNNTHESELKRKASTMLDFITAKTKKSASGEKNNSSEDSTNSELQDVKEINFRNKDLTKEDDIVCSKLPESPDGETEKEYSEEMQHLETPLCEPIISSDITSHKMIKAKTFDSSKEVLYLDSTDNMPNTQIRNISDVIFEKSHSNYNKLKSNIEHQERKPKTSKVITDKEDLGKLNRKTVNLKTSLEHVQVLTQLFTQDQVNSAPMRVKFKGEINPVFNKKCEEELCREISKDSFKEMIVVGQFNLGFIITKLDDDLFIIDQHATDEIYNFETIQKNTELTSQKLVIPQQLELTGVNEQILMDNLDVFKKNGFTFEINPDALPTKRVKLLTLPMSKNWVFGIEDIEELLFMLRESPSEYCRPSRVRAMFASRACRKSVMIGTALSRSDMNEIVNHMAEIDKPWNCPHGRPTIRHLVNLAMIQTREE